MDPQSEPTPLSSTSVPLPTVSPEIPMPSRFKKVVKVLLSGLLILLIILTPVVIYLDHRDLPSVDQSGLTLDNPQVPDSENMIFDLEKLKLSSTTDTTLLVSTLAAPQLDTAAASKMIQGNEDMIGAFLQASEKPYYQDPLTAHPPLDERKVSQFGTLRVLVRIVCLDARVKAQAPAGLIQAHDELAAVLKVGNRMGSEQGTIIGFLVAQAILKMGYQTVNILGIKDPNFAQYANTAHGAYLAVVEEYYARNVTGLKDIKALAQNIATEPEGTVNIAEENELLKPFRFNPLDGFYYQPHRTQQFITDIYRREASYVAYPCSYNPFWYPNTEFPLPLTGLKAYFTENYVGQIFFSTAITNLGGIRDRRCEVETLAQQ